MADVARLLPRHWDGQRLLRFLTGLALLALAFAAHAGLTTSPPPASPAPAMPAAAAPAPEIAAAPAPVIAVAPVSAEDAVAVDRPAAEADVLRIGVQSGAAGDVLRIGVQSKAGVRASGGFAVPGGVVPGAHGSRGPPLA